MRHNQNHQTHRRWHRSHQVKKLAHGLGGPCYVPPLLATRNFMPRTRGLVHYPQIFAFFATFAVLPSSVIQSLCQCLSSVRNRTMERYVESWKRSGAEYAENQSPPLLCALGSVCLSSANPGPEARYNACRRTCPPEHNATNKHLSTEGAPQPKSPRMCFAL